jgi:hypothetical protein
MHCEWCASLAMLILRGVYRERKSIFRGRIITRRKPNGQRAL